jgi:hypothetical protein
MITEDFEAISSDEHVQAFVDRYVLKPCQVAKSAWNMGEWTGGVGTDAAPRGFRWYDPSGPFNMQADIRVIRVVPKGDLQRIETGASYSRPTTRCRIHPHCAIL